MRQTQRFLSLSFLLSLLNCRRGGFEAEDYWRNVILVIILRSIREKIIKSLYRDVSRAVLAEIHWGIIIIIIFLIFMFILWMLLFKKKKRDFYWKLANDLDKRPLSLMLWETTIVQFSSFKGKGMCNLPNLTCLWFKQKAVVCTLMQSFDN